MVKKYAIFRGVTDAFLSLKESKVGGIFSLWLAKGLFDTREEAEQELEKQVDHNNRFFFITEVYFKDVNSATTDL